MLVPPGKAASLGTLLKTALLKTRVSFFSENRVIEVVEGFVVELGQPLLKTLLLARADKEIGRSFHQTRPPSIPDTLKWRVIRCVLDTDPGGLNRHHIS